MRNTSKTNLKIVNSLEGINITNWKQFIANHPKGNIFQSPEIFAFYKRQNGFDPKIFICLDQLNVIHGVLLCVIHFENGNLRKLFTRRCIVIGGPLVHEDNINISELMIREMVSSVFYLSIYIEFRNLFDMNFMHNIFLKNNFAYKKHINYIVPLTTLEENKKLLSTSKLRQVKSSLKSGLVIQIATTERQITDLYNILFKLYRDKVKKPLPNIQFFLDFFRTPQLGKILIIEKDLKVLGGIVCPVFINKTIYEWYICGIDGNENGIHPSVLATWGAIEFGITNKLSNFDFLGAGSPDSEYGVREFKSKFGGREVCYGRYTRINNYILYLIGKFGLSLLRIQRSK